MYRINYKLGTKRPLVGLFQSYFCIPITYKFNQQLEDEVAEFQKEFDLTVDGIIGKNTREKLFEQIFSEKNINDILWYLSAELTAHFELSANQDVFGSGSVNEIDDGAGKNYGFFQMNSKGSLRDFKRWSGLNIDEDKKVLNSRECRIKQMEYFKEFIFNKAQKKVKDYYKLVTNLKDWEKRLFILIAVDSKVQAGACYPYQNIKVYGDLTLNEHDTEVFYDVLDHDDNDRALKKILKRDLEEPAKVYAEFISRVFSKRWWKDIQSRRLCIANAQGKVHGSNMDLFNLLGLIGYGG